MKKASQHVWFKALAGVGPRTVAAVALIAAFAVVAPNEGNLDTGTQQPGQPDQGALEDPLGVVGSMGGVRELTTADSVRLAADAEELSIPPVALAAYQRSATVLNDADATCRIDWALVAAIGMVESNHGRHGGSELGTNGAASPAIIGAPLDGKDGRALIRDTDRGLYDHDTVYDRAVGPMQFIPSTWTYAGADGDGDNRRDPQDIDDAAVAGAAYLCAGTEDVSTDAGARSAVFRYNQSQTYVDTVLKIADQYRNGEFPGSAVVDGGSPSTMKPTVSALPPKTVRAEKPAAPEPTPSAEPTEDMTTKAAPAPTAPKPSASSTPTDDSTEDATGDGSDSGETESGDGTTTPTPTPTPTPTDPPTTEDPTPEQQCATAVVEMFPALSPDATPESPSTSTSPEDDAAPAPTLPQMYANLVELCGNWLKDSTADTTEAIIAVLLDHIVTDPTLIASLIELGLWDETTESPAISSP